MSSKKSYKKYEVSSEESSSDEEDRRKKKSHKQKKHKKKSKKHKKHRKYSSSSENTSSDEWVEKEKSDSDTEPTNRVVSRDKFDRDEDTNKRDEWMSLTGMIPTVSKSEMRKEKDLKKQADKREGQYDPTKSARELNPYWKDGGDGLPSTVRSSLFKKPTGDGWPSYNKVPARRGNWRKNERRPPSPDESKPIKSDDWNNKHMHTYVISNLEEEQNETNQTFTEKDINDIAAKLIKAEILGNTSLVSDLKKKLDFAREAVKLNPCPNKNDEQVVLTNTDAKGYSRPLEKISSAERPSGSKRKEKVETHSQGKRIRYFSDDDKYSLQQMFEQEKYNNSYDQDAEFVKMSGKFKNIEDTDDIFVDNVRKKASDEKLDEKNKQRAISQHNTVSRSLENCSFCVDSPRVLKHLIVTFGENVFLSLPSYKSLTTGHCFLVPVRHVPCSTQLDEDVWTEIQNFRKALVKMFAALDLTTVFFEHVVDLQRFPHMIIQCIPLPRNEGEMAPIYFKKAILECETEWSTNKKLVDLKGSNVRRKVPKGLPYFFVEFGMGDGFAHVIEDKKDFPYNFAPEIIGGILDLPHHLWRKPTKESYGEQKSKTEEFKEMWDEFDITKK